jgi:hypothetical protein
MFRHSSILVSCFLLLSMTQYPASAGAEVPTPTYETSLSGYTIPHARDVVVDDSGNAYLIGSAYQDGTHLDVLVAKLGPDGGPAWTRYITASNHCYATGLALDSNRDVWVTGWTDAPDFPMVNAMDNTLTGFRDVFLMKLDTDDGSILYSTFLGGDYVDAAQGLALNAADEIFLTGYTGSTDFPVTPDAWQPGPSFPEYFYKDAFITKIAPTGDRILYSTYFGGLHDDRAEMIALDGASNIVIAGFTDANDFPLVNALQTTPNDVFISKLSADGSTLLFSTYFGGEDIDRLGQMELDDSGNLYLVGTTRSVGFPTTVGAFQENFIGAINGCEVPFGEDYNCEDIFVTKLATDGGGLIWSTYLGGTKVEEGRGIEVDGAGRVYVTGYTGSADFPPSGMDFGAEIIVCRLDATGSTLDYTYSIDSGSANRGNGIVLDAEGDVYFTGTVGVPADVYISKLTGRQLSAVGEGTPSVVRLDANYPNPFNPGTTISFELGSSSVVSLQIFDMGGHIVRRLIGGDLLSPGRHEVSWRGRDDSGRKVAAGAYFYRIEAGGFSETKRMVLIK